MTYLPDNVEVFQLTALEVAQSDDDMIYEYMKRREFRLASMSGRVRDAMFDAMIEEEGIAGGWYWSNGDFPHGSFDSADEARADALMCCAA